jgi:septal ring factor EnvC (AmiA/AmiB activator)
MDTLLNIRRFFDAFKSLSFWQRLFSWASIRSLSYSAYEELIQLNESLKTSQVEIESIKKDKELLLQERNSLLQQLTDSKTSLAKADVRLQHCDQELKRIENENMSLQKKLVFMEQGEDQRKREHDSRIQRVIGLQDNLKKKSSP